MSKVYCELDTIPNGFYTLHYAFTHYTLHTGVKQVSHTRYPFFFGVITWFSPRFGKEPAVFFDRSESRI